MNFFNKFKLIPIILLSFVILLTIYTFILKENDLSLDIKCNTKIFDQDLKLICNNLNDSSDLFIEKAKNITKVNKKNISILTLQSNDLAGCDKDCQNLRNQLRLNRVSKIFKNKSRFIESNFLKNLSTQCDSECLRFRKYLSVMPANNIRAAIYILTHVERVRSIVYVLQKLDEYFNDQYKYPIIIFHGEDILNQLDAIQKETRSMLFFQKVTFEIPKSVDLKLIPEYDCRRKKIGYRHMCRFHAIQVYREPIMLSNGLDYVWRLDDDSEFLGPILYDPISYMSFHNFKYSYLRILHGSDTCFEGFWETMDEYVRTRRIDADNQFYLKWPKHYVFFNNFEISELQFWKSQKYQDFVDFIDKKGGIFYYRWGDAEIKTAAVALFLQSDEIFRFWDISYKHVDWMQKQPSFEN